MFRSYTGIKESGSTPARGAGWQQHTGSGGAFSFPFFNKHMTAAEAADQHLP